jgi:heat-inducible transcriptional repressor
MNDRRSLILRAIVSHYVRSNEPVGSKTLVERYNLGVSPATVRNEMAALEEAGYISQPHTSAGRVPTDIGYRHFVDRFGTGGKLPAAEARQVETFFGEPRFELEDALRHTAGLLSHITDHAAIVFAPALDRSVVRHVELVGLSGRRAMVVVVTDTGRVENHVIGVPDGPGEEELERTAGILNKLIAGAPLEDAAGKITGELRKMPVELRELAAEVAKSLSRDLNEREENGVFLEGASNIVSEHKFHDLETVRQVIGALEHRRLLLEVLADALTIGRVAVRIGSENTSSEMQNCTVVAAPYGNEDEHLGTLGVVGPTRMDYRRTIAAVNEVAVNLGRMMGSLGI